MHDLETLRSGAYVGQGLTKLKLSCPLAEFPSEILDLADTLEQLDLSGTGLRCLPAEFGLLKKLKVAFFSNCRFDTFPVEMAACPELEMVAFRANNMSSIPENALPAKLRWLILTNNAVQELPRSIGRCGRLQKCMLAGNQLRRLPEEMANCTNLALLRLSANELSEVPGWLFSMPRLAFLSVAGNPCCPGLDRGGEGRANNLKRVPWRDVSVDSILGEGASGSIYRGEWVRSHDSTQEVAVKLFKGSVTSDGTPQDEMAACVVAGSHPHLIDTLAVIDDHPEREGLLMQLIPPHYSVLGLPPSLASCTRDNYETGKRLDLWTCVRILRGIASAACHLHELDISHGDLYAHNILVDPTGHALLGDFGAASFYRGAGQHDFERLEVLAFGYLVEDMLGIFEVSDWQDTESLAIDQLRLLREQCVLPVARSRPVFIDIVQSLTNLDVTVPLAN